MSTEVTFFDFPGDLSPKQINEKISAFTKGRNIVESLSSTTGLSSPIQWYREAKISLDAAKQYIADIDAGGKQIAVRYRSYENVCFPITFYTSKRKAEVAIEKAKQVASEFAFKNTTRQWIRCKYCCSKLNAHHVRTNNCPVCRADLRSLTQLDRIQRLQERAQDAVVKALDTDRRILKKYASAADIRWLVKIEYHV